MFWEIVGKLIDDNNISQTQLSEAIGKEKSQVNKWIKRGTIPPADAAVKIAKYFNTTVEYLVTGIDSRYEGLTESKRKLRMIADIQTEENLKMFLDLLDMLLKASKLLVLPK